MERPSMSQLREARFNALTSRIAVAPSSDKPTPRVLAPASPPRLASTPSLAAQPKRASNSTTATPFLPPAPRTTSGPSFAERSAALLRKAQEAANQTAIPARNTTGFSQPATAATATQKQKQRYDPLAGLEDGLDTGQPTGPHAGAGMQRDERMRLIEELQPGPAEVPDNFDDPHWMKHEPFSGTRLRKRHTPHGQLEGHLQGRYFIPPSLLYSLAQPASGGTKSGADGDFEVPVVGDWITMAVIVEKSAIKVTKGRKAVDNEATGAKWAKGKRKEKHNPDDELNFDVETRGDRLPGEFRQTQNDNDDEEASNDLAPKKYLMLRLVDLGAPLTSSVGGPATHGSATLTMMVFEADRTWLEPGGKRKYAGGSGGVFELLCKLDAGALVAIMNPKLSKSRGILVPTGGGTRGKDTPAEKSASNIFMLKCNSQSSVLIVGQAADFATCEANTLAGVRCSTFVDRRSGTTVCDLHLTKAISKSRNARQAFANSTSGFAQTGTAAANFSLNKFHGADAGRGVQRVSEVAASDSLRAEGGSGAPFDTPVRYGQTHVVGGSKKQIKASDPLSLQFDVSARYGRGKAEKEQRHRKAQEETDMILALERKKRDVGRAGTGAAASGRAALVARLDEEEPEEASGLHSVGARALFDAKRKLEDARATASAKRAAKRAKTTASASTRCNATGPVAKATPRPLSAAEKRRKARAARRAIFTDDSESDSPSDNEDDIELDMEEEQGMRSSDDALAPVLSPPRAMAHKFTHAPEVIKKIGFDPFGRSRRPGASGGVSGVAFALSRDRLLARTQAPYNANAPSKPLPQRPRPGPIARAAPGAAVIQPWRDDVIRARQRDKGDESDSSLELDMTGFTPPTRDAGAAVVAVGAAEMRVSDDDSELEII